MEIKIPEDCGNSPRMAIVSDYAASWAAGDADALAERHASDFRWELVGSDAVVDTAVGRGRPFRLRTSRCSRQSTTAASRVATAS